MELAGLRVLVVEDDAATRELLVMILRLCGADVVAAASVAEAIVSVHESLPTAIVSDISMPEQDGYALVRRLQEGGLEIPVIAVTAHRYEHTRQRTLAAGFRDHLTKPIEPATLCGAVAAVTAGI
jgi:CheY-like chemotaxis protein